jgi:hypothetical protein
VSKLNIIILFFSLWFSGSAYAQNLYKITKDGNNIILDFNNNWYFSKIAIPVRSIKIWKDNFAHNAAIIQLGNEKHVLSSKPNEKYLEYNELTFPIDKITLTSINISSESVEECLPIFKATSSKTKFIEDNLLLISERENDFIKNNKCFSCHSLIPAALAFNTAYIKGYHLESMNVNKLMANFSSLQREDGSFYFENQPIYGINSTTLSAAFIASLFSDMATPDFIKIGIKINKFIKLTHKPNEVIRADFIFEPFFNNETTSLLFEVVFQKILYLKDFENQKESFDRSIELLSMLPETENLEFNKKLLLFCGIPYSKQLTAKERKELIPELQKHFEMPYSKISEISRLLSLYLYKKINTNEKLPLILSEKESDLNKTSIIWNCFKEIMYNSPQYLDGSYDER